MTEFEEITLKKIIKGKIVDEFYVNLGVTLGSNKISNRELSEKIGWDPAGISQKQNRNSDMRFSTFITMLVAISELSDEKSGGGVSPYLAFDELAVDRLVTFDSFMLGKLFIHVSASIEGREEFLCDQQYVKIYKKLRPFVFNQKRAPRFSEKEQAVYKKYYDKLCGAAE